MLTFFRKIRAALLAEGKTAKYLKYAIGEIFLVVIGILLALSINNWNEERKNENTIAIYKKSLIEDLQKEITKSQRAIWELEEELAELNTFCERISQNSFNLDSIVNIYRFEFNHEIGAYDINTKMLDALITTGNINLLEKNLYNHLMSLQGIQEKTIQEIELNKDFFMIYSTRITLPFNDAWNAFEGEALERIWEDIDKKGFLRDFNATLSSKIMVNKFIIKSQNELLNATESVLKELNDQD